MDSVDAVDMPDRETGRAGRLAEPGVWGPRTSVRLVFTDELSEPRQTLLNLEIVQLFQRALSVVAGLVVLFHSSPCGVRQGFRAMVLLLRHNSGVVVIDKIHIVWKFLASDARVVLSWNADRDRW